MYWDSPPARALRAAGIPVYRAIESAVTSLARLVDSEEHGPLPKLPAAATTPLAGGGGYFAAREALAAAGVSFGDARPARDGAGAAAAAAAIGYPVVLKAVDELHKSDSGGVVVGIGSEEELLAAVERWASGAVGRADGGSRRRLRLLIGARRDARFGPIVLAGAGGLHAETLADTAVALAR